MTPAEEAVLRFRAALQAPPDRVFAALTQVGHLTRWFCDECESDPRNGGHVMFRWHGPGASAEPFTGSWTAFEPSRRCAFSGGHAGYPDGYGGRITFTLEPADTVTLLVAEHAMPASIDYASIAQTYTSAWPRALERLAGYLTPA